MRNLPQLLGGHHAWDRSAAVIGVAGCGSDGSAVAVAQRTSSPSRALPSALVGQWPVRGERIEPGTAVNLGARRLDVFLRRGILSGSWDARPGGAFLAQTGGGSSECFPAGAASCADAEPSWLRAAATFAVEGEGRVLLDTAGRSVAVLAPGPRPTVPSTVADSVAEGPQVRAEERAALDRDRQRLVRSAAG